MKSQMDVLGMGPAVGRGDLMIADMVEIEKSGVGRRWRTDCRAPADYMAYIES